MSQMSEKDTAEKNRQLYEFVQRHDKQINEYLQRLALAEENLRRYRADHIYYRAYLRDGKTQDGRFEIAGTKGVLKIDTAFDGLDRMDNLLDHPAVTGALELTATLDLLDNINNTGIMVLAGFRHHFANRRLPTADRKAVVEVLLERIDKLSRSVLEKAHLVDALLSRPNNFGAHERARVTNFRAHQWTGSLGTTYAFMQKAAHCLAQLPGSEGMNSETELLVSAMSPSSQTKMHESIILNSSAEGFTSLCIGATTKPHLLPVVDALLLEFDGVYREGPAVLSNAVAVSRHDYLLWVGSSTRMTVLRSLLSFVARLQNAKLAFDQAEERSRKLGITPPSLTDMHTEMKKFSVRALNR